VNAGTLVGVDELRSLIGHDDVLVIDCRFELRDALRSERDYAAAHIAGAVYADLDRDLSDLTKVGLGRHPLPDASAFSAALGRWGWTARKRVVAYDNAGGVLAASRLWWMLRLIGHFDVAVLDGGLAAWTDAGLPLESAATTPTPTTVAAQFDADQILYTDQLQQERESIFLLDARAAPRFRGDIEPLDAVAGHVPGAANRPFSENLVDGTRFKSPAALRAEFSALLGDVPPERVAHMCGSGVTACHNLLSMEVAGLHGSRVYAPSWSGWLHNRERPVATGDA
jgi:thiosulfate/3-mercaptopyruvate sulfurtransferase